MKYALRIWAEVEIEADSPGEAIRIGCKAAEQAAWSGVDKVECGVAPSQANPIDAKTCKRIPAGTFLR